MKILKKPEIQFGCPPQLTGQNLGRPLCMGENILYKLETKELSPITTSFRFFLVRTNRPKESGVVLCIVTFEMKYTELT